ncbi:hypothetical protein H6F76_24850 [Leptolyngbya sp. FACHB-321]|uniref:hypothetical protein n=1 Tax=Leptolyngbya sp. FACHB-321 TaxID=2692807 RepID=UPI001683E7EF|nr:hypothetical protein [Leptolyngbya sp. FACHB-321]MBD2038187.1 hypothetical protein [Leptolyngbya sp. FACHB-321]
MRQNPKVEPPNQLPQPIALHPVLSTALAHLDIQLEDELVRYRRQRTAAGRTVRQPGRKRSSESLDLIAVSATAGGVNTPAAKPVPLLDQRLADVAGQAAVPDTYKPIPAFTATPQPFDGAIALRTDKQSQDNANDVSLSGGEDAHALAQAGNPDLDDYLESSEELLRSLADQQAEVQAERHFMQSLLTPLGVGAMLLLLLSSAMFGYVIMNPSSLPWLTAKRTNDAGLSPEPAAGQRAIAPPQPDLAKRELPELNLNNLGTINVSPGAPSSTALSKQATATPSSKPTVTTTAPVESQSSNEPAAQVPIPAVTSNSSRPYARTSEPPQTAPLRAPEPVQPPVAPVRRAPAVTAPATTTAPAASASSQSTGEASSAYQYKVGIPFENDQTLENARKVVPDAFVRTLPDGKTIVQVGAARNETELKANVERLRDQGLSSTEVYKR